MKSWVVFSFPRQAKILKTDDFSSVFNFRKRIANKHLVMRYCPNAYTSARLGLIVSKKTAKLAVHRNYMRRVIRELFRLNLSQLPNVDLVIQIQKAFNQPDFVVIKTEFDFLMKKLVASVPVSSNPIHKVSN